MVQKRKLREPLRKNTRRPEIASSKYTKQLWDISRHLRTKGRKSLVKQKNKNKNKRGTQTKGENSKRKIFSNSLKIPRKAQKLLMRMKNIHMVVTRFQVPREEPKPLFKTFTQRSQIFMTKFGFSQVLVISRKSMTRRSFLPACCNCKRIYAARRKTMLINQLLLQ